MSEQNSNGEEPVIRDKRKIDPETGEARPASESSPDGADAGDPLTVEDILAAGEGAGEPEGTALSPDAALAAERLEDLQRLSAEYANYRKRTERERELLREALTGDVLASFLPILDDLALAEAHGDLAEGPLAVIFQKFRTLVADRGLEAFGAKGETFDPHLHEAIAQVPVPGTPEGTIIDVVQTGYRIGERVLRAAKVAVAAATPDAAE